MLTLRAEEFSGDVDGLAADDDDLLSVEELLGDDAGETTEEMALAVNDDLVKVLVCIVASECRTARSHS